jgi:ribosome-binding factor A
VGYVFFCLLCVGGYEIFWFFWVGVMMLAQVKMSGDLRKAFVLWKALPGMQPTVERELNAQGRRLRSMVFEHLSMPFSPAIEFRQDKVNPEAQAIDDILAKLDEESDWPMLAVIWVLYGFYWSLAALPLLSTATSASQVEAVQEKEEDLISKRRSLSWSL